MRIYKSPFKDGLPTRNTKSIEATNFKWSNDGRNLSLEIETEFEEFALIFNGWGVEKPLISKTGIFLKQSSYVTLKK